MSPYKSISHRSGSGRRDKGKRQIPLLPLFVGVVVGVVSGFFVGYVVRLQTGTPQGASVIVKATPLPTMSQQKLKSQMKDFVRGKLEEVGPGSSEDRLIKLSEVPAPTPTVRLEDIGRE